uniref:DDE Tnp4 domain-containing protein n=1 Tax=Cyprinus carpio TaxID=7962 RepID=A0A8C1MDJ0_CYPCA
LVAELRLDRDRHLKYFRMSAEQMDHILSLIGGHLSRQTTNYRQSIQPKQRLAVTLSFTSLAFQYRLGKSTVAESVHMTCRAIEEQMMASQFPRPTEHMWRAIASKFWEKWNFPNCIGAIDGKHVTIMSPAHSGSLFFNYKRTFSIVLLALADAEYRFTFVQVGDFGRTSDGGVFSGPLPYTMVGVAAFPLKTYLMRPFPGNRIPRWRQMFNYRLSRARMIVECAFGILSSRWRVLHTRINVKPDNADCIVTAACILHNFLTNPSDNQRWLDEAEERGEVLAPATNMGGNRGCREAYEVREKLCTFFSSPEGRVSWQDNMV